MFTVLFQRERYSIIHLDKTLFDILSTIRESSLTICKDKVHYEYLSEIDLGKLIVFFFVLGYRIVTGN